LVKKILTSLGIPVGTPLDYPRKIAEQLYMKMSSFLISRLPSRGAYHYGVTAEQEAEQTNQKSIQHLRARVDKYCIFGEKE
jgi:hypothetical protein